MDPMISVLMLVKDITCLLYLVEAIESILHQKFTDFELIIIYGDMAKETKKFLIDSARKDSRIKLIPE